MKTTFLLAFLFFYSFSLTSNAQASISSLSETCEKGDIAIIELRLNTEDEFRTLEGRDNQGLSRIAIYTGENKDNEILSKGFTGFNQVTSYLNEMKDNGWKLISTYPINGQSLIITHYVFEKSKG